MKKIPFQLRVFVIILFSTITKMSYSQNVGINTTGASPNAAAILDLNTGNSGSMGFLPEQVSLTATNTAGPITLPPTGLLVYNKATAGVSPHNVVPGYYYNAGTTGAPNWVLIIAGTASGVWLTNGNAGTVDGTNYIGTTDNIPLSFQMNSQKSGRIDGILANTFLGYQSGGAVTSQNNTAIGNTALSANTSGSYNVAIGSATLSVNTLGINNVGVGAQALSDNLAGSDNTACGYSSMLSNSSGLDNVACGYSALQSNTIASNNTATGYSALFANVSAPDNTANGYDALKGNTYGSQNTAMGSGALQSQAFANGSSIWATNNTAVGYQALFANNPTSNANGFQNVAIGSLSLTSNTTGANNIAIGYKAGKTNTSGSSNTFIGTQADANANNYTNATAIGNGAIVTASNTIMFGNTSVIGWGFGATPTSGAQALIVGSTTSNGNGANLTLTGNWTSTSDSTKKRNIQNIAYGLPEVMKLRPVSYSWKGTTINDIGFLAQEVKHILPEVVYGEEGHMTISYGQITPVLTKAIQEQQMMIDSLKAENEKLKNTELRDEADIISLKKMVNNMFQLQVSVKQNN